MTIKKIKYVLEKAGLSNFENKWIRIPYFTVVKITQDSNYYIGESSAFYFDSTNNVMHASEHVSQETDLTGKTLTDIVPESTYSFDAIGGFISSAVLGPQGTYYTKRF